MLFSEKLRNLRGDKNISQTELSKLLGISMRTVQNYESGKCYPKNTEIYKKLAEIFGVSPNFLISDGDRYIMDAEEQGGKSAGREVKELLAEVGGLFAGGDLSDEDKEKVMRTINELYWRAKDEKRKIDS
ncbi:MAG: helix-turn-helix transcriptional regulator [Eubacteriales bacterium]